MNTPTSPEIIYLDDDQFGNHAQHWQLLSDQPEQDVPAWLSAALNQPIMPMGLCVDEKNMNSNLWLIQNHPQDSIIINQVIAVENEKPRALKTAFPSFHSPYKYSAEIERIISSPSATEAVLRLRLNQNTIIYAFDNLYSVNAASYAQGQMYDVQLNAWAYELQAVAAHEQLVVDDPASIKQHRALNQILAEHDGVAPDNLQELIDAWQPKTPEDEMPVTVDFSKMVAYLFGESIGQEDEAWFQGHIVGKSNFEFKTVDYCIYDVVLVLEDQLPAILIRIATRNDLHKNFEIGDYIRGNIWIQANIYAKTETTKC